MKKKNCNLIYAIKYLTNKFFVVFLFNYEIKKHMKI